MLIDVNERTRNHAKLPHELSLVNLAAFHLFAGPAAIVLDIGLWGFLVPLGLSLSFISYVWLRAQWAQSHESWYIAAHWRLAANRTKVLLVGYLICALLLAIAEIISAESSKSEIMMIALSRVAIVPVLITVMISFVLGTSAVAQARRGEIPDSLAKKFPPSANQVLLENTPE